MRLASLSMVRFVQPSVPRDGHATGSLTANIPFVNLMQLVACPTQTGSSLCKHQSNKVLDNSLVETFYMTRAILWCQNRICSPNSHNHPSSEKQL